MGRLERGHQGDAAAGRQRRQHLIGIDPHQGWHDEGRSSRVSRRSSRRANLSPLSPEDSVLCTCAVMMWLVFATADPARQAGSANSPASRGCRAAETAAASSDHRRGARAVASGHPIPMKAAMAKAVRSLPQGQTTTDADPWSKYLARFRTCPNESYSAGCPTRRALKEHKHLRLFGKLLLDANLWHLNRRAPRPVPARSASSWPGFPPCQMLLAAGGAIACRVNLPSRWPWSGSPTPDHATRCFMAPIWWAASCWGNPPSTSRSPSPGPGWCRCSRRWPRRSCWAPGACPAERPRRLSPGSRAGWRLSTVRQWQKRKVARAMLNRWLARFKIDPDTLRQQSGSRLFGERLLTPPSGRATPGPLWRRGGRAVRQLGPCAHALPGGRRPGAGVRLQPAAGPLGGLVQQPADAPLHVPSTPIVPAAWC